MAAIQESGSGNSRGGKVRARRRSTRIDMTPMVDLAFLLLTFFMLTTTFSKHYVMPVSMPEKPKSPVEEQLVNEKKVLTLVLHEKDKIFWHVGTNNPVVRETDYSSQGIRKVLLEQNAVIDNMVVLIKPSSHSRYKNIVDIFDEIAITKMERFALVKITPEDLALVTK